ncbi:MAG: hypothetical protein SFX18_17480 [Pirellulales bacterium]|nr:hypothetical protein [Pirellulales bacterium]
MEATSSFEPTVPRPPELEIERVYPDLARILTDAEQDTDGLRAVAQDSILDQLKSSGHLSAAIEWAVYLLCKDGMLFTTILKKQQLRTVQPGVSEAKARTIDVPAIAATEIFWEKWRSGLLSPRPKEVVLLIHGIRTFAEWQPMVKRVLEEIPNTKVIPIKYGYLDAIRFWCPFFTRQFAIIDLRRQIQDAKASNVDSEVSVIAHSFGTYAITQILVDNPDIKLHHLILSGSIVPRSYRWDYVRSRLATDVLNDYGTKDFWPVLAKCLTWGYGDTGRHGFGRNGVTDRGFDYKHSDFFNEDFVRKYWKPWIEANKVVPSPWDEKAPPASWFLNVLSILPLQWLLCGLVVVLVYWIFFSSPKYADVPATATPITLVDATFQNYVSDLAAPQLDIIVGNSLDRAVVVKRLKLQVHRIWNLHRLPTPPQAYLPSEHNYLQWLDNKGTPYTRELPLQQEVPARGNSRFTVQFQERRSEDLFAAHTIYFATISLLADADNKVIGTQDIAFMISFNGAAVPSQAELADAISHEEQMGRPIDRTKLNQQIRDNREMLKEVSKLTSTRNPALQSAIEQLKPNSTSTLDDSQRRMVEECDYRLEIIISELDKPPTSKYILDKLDRTINGFSGPYYGLYPENERRSIDQISVNLANELPNRREYFNGLRIAISDVVPLVTEVQLASQQDMLIWNDVQKAKLSELVRKLKEQRLHLKD